MVLFMTSHAGSVSIIGATVSDPCMAERRDESFFSKLLPFCDIFFGTLTLIFCREEDFFMFSSGVGG
jgi:hypothetical protein